MPLDAGPNQRLDVDFYWPPNQALLTELRRLMTALEARFSGLEAIAGTFEESVAQFQTLGLERLNDVLTPLATEAITQLQDITRLFGATSTTEEEIGLGTKLFQIPPEQRNTFVPTPYLAIYAAAPGAGENGMIAERVSLDRDLGILTVNVVAVTGSGTFDDWSISVSPSPSLSGYTKGEVDTAILDAINGLSAALTSLINAKAPITSPSFLGTPTAITPSALDDSTRLPTTAWVNDTAAAIAAGLIAQIPGSALDEASDAQIRGGTAGLHAITAERIPSASAVITLQDQSTIGVDWNTFINAQVTLGGNRTLGNPSNGQPGTWRSILVLQDSNGTRTLAYGNQYLTPGGIKPVIATGNGKASRLLVYCRTATVFELYAAGLGFA